MTTPKILTKPGPLTKSDKQALQAKLADLGGKKPAPQKKQPKRKK